LSDILVAFVIVLAGATVVVAIEYYRQLRRAQMEYEKSRTVVEDIVLSFNRQFKQTSERLEAIAYKVEAGVSRSDNALRKSEEVDQLIRALESRIVADSRDKESISSRLVVVDERVTASVTSLEEAIQRIVSLEEKARELRLTPETNLEGVIPLKRERAMAQLTDTEVAVLELLVSEGAKTSPEIKERIKLSREHTARLMKKLYEGGYLERETAKTPFRYSVKKEMEKLLKKTESQAA
jgi:DNA-binding MarR family transcriptional regulator